MLSILRFGLCVFSFASLMGCVMSSGWLVPAPLTPEQVQNSVGTFEETRFIQEHVASVASPILVLNADFCKVRTATV